MPNADRYTFGMPNADWHTWRQDFVTLRKIKRAWKPLLEGELDFLFSGDHDFFDSSSFDIRV
jgi:hypothetical protein